MHRGQRGSLPLALNTRSVGDTRELGCWVGIAVSVATRRPPSTIHLEGAEKGAWGCYPP